MLIDETNDFQPITVLIEEKELAAVKSILHFLKERYTDFSLQKFKTGKIGDNVIVYFKVNQNHYKRVLEKFAFNEIPVIMKDKKVKDFITEKRELKEKKLKASGWSELSFRTNSLTVYDLERFASKGKIKEMVQAAKGGVGSNIEIVEKAKYLLSKTIFTAVEKAYQNALNNINNGTESIEQLLQIAADKDLRIFQKNEEMIYAGELAIKISIIDESLFKNLIKIANNNNIEHLVNIKATLRLSKILEHNSNHTLLNECLKFLNTRWLKIACESVLQKLPPEEIRKFELFVEVIEEKRKAA